MNNHLRVKAVAISMMAVAPICAVLDHLICRNRTPWTLGQRLRIYWRDSAILWAYPWIYGHIEHDGFTFRARRDRETGCVQTLSDDGGEWHLVVGRQVEFIPDTWWGRRGLKLDVMRWGGGAGG